jgi:hypothetical protein
MGGATPFGSQSLRMQPSKARAGSPPWVLIKSTEKAPTAEAPAAKGSRYTPAQITRAQRIYGKVHH